MTPETQETTNTAAEAKPQTQQQPAELPQAQSLLDRIVSESQVAQRDAIIVKRAEFDQKQRLAKMFAKSGCFKDIDKDEDDKWLAEDISIARAMVKIELGESMGFSAAESVTGIDIIKGRVAVGAALRGARMQREGFTWPQMIVTDKGCWMPLCYKGQPMLCPKVKEDGTIVLGEDGKPVMVQVVVSFTEKDAKALGLLEKRGSMYLKDPSSMYFARAMTRAQRRYGPGVLGVDLLDTYEARDIPDDRPIPAINIDQFKASTDPNRGHDQVTPEPVKETNGTGKPAESKSAEPETPKEDPKPQPKEEPKQDAGWESWDEAAKKYDGDKNAEELGKIIVVDGKTYTREKFEDDWKVVTPIGASTGGRKRNAGALDFGK